MKHFVSVGFGVFSMLVANSAMATEIKPFIGANLAINGVVWSHDAERATEDMGIDLPEAFLGLGLEMGVKFVNDNIYNAGLIFAYDYAFNSKAKLDSNIKDYYYKVTTGFSSIAITFDNYIRVSGEKAHRKDVVVGIGLARGTERISMKTTYYGYTSGLEDIDDDDDGTFILLKAGYNHQLSDNVDFYTNGRAFIPTAGDGDVDVIFNLSAGLRFVF